MGDRFHHRVVGHVVGGGSWVLEERRTGLVRGLLSSVCVDVVVLASL